MSNDSLEQYARLMATLGHPQRLSVLHQLIQCYPEPLKLSDFHNELNLPLDQLKLALKQLYTGGFIAVQAQSNPVQYTLKIAVLEDLLAFFYAECCVRQRVLDWGKVVDKKERWQTQIELGNVEQENLANFLDTAIYARLGGKALQVLLLARSEAERCQQLPINTAHLLLGLCLEGGTPMINQLFKRWQLNVELIRALLKTVQLPKQFVRHTSMFTPEAIVSLRFALEEATEVGGILINTEHLLVGLIREWELSREAQKPITMAAQLLHQTGLTPSDLLTQLRAGMPLA